MFFSASIAFTLVLSLSGIAVRSAPVTRQIVPLGCTGPNGTGTCSPLNVASPNPPPLPAINPAACTHLPAGVRSLVLNPDNSCVTFSDLNCQSGPVEHYSNDSADLPAGTFRSVSCEEDPGFVNGLLAGFEG
ncbi:hypothetical protein C8R43DRAFT_700643 [Mycena crocata]|nr:hypothetical protein C8R43DRAFT_700643 [Mycena crocata]